MQFQAVEKEIFIDLFLKSTKPIVLQGNQGLSQKGTEPGNASYYYSLTRLATKGDIQIKDSNFKIEGLAWLDREWSTSALSKDKIGWDWFSLQLDDGREIMYYQIRKRDGRSDEFSSGTIINKDSSPRPINLQDVSIKVLDYWTSPRRSDYPSRWRFNIPEDKLISG